MSAFVGVDTGGTWQLTVRNGGTTTTGRLNLWSLSFQVQNFAPTFGTTPIPAPIYTPGEPVSLTLPEATGGNGPLNHNLLHRSGPTFAELGLSVSAGPDRRVISGTVSATATAGESMYTYRVQDADDDSGLDDRQDLTLRITVVLELDVMPVFNAAGPDDQNYTTGVPINLTLPVATSGNAPLRYALADGAGNLPDGLAFDADSRVLSGSPTTAQDATAYTYTVTDDDDDIDTLTFMITVVLDTTRPSVTLRNTAPALTNQPTLSFMVEFNELVRDFDRDDISITGTLNNDAPTVSNFAGSGADYTFDVERGASDGTVVVSIPANVAMDRTGNNNTASNTIRRTVDTVRPTINRGSTLNPTAIDIGFSEPVRFPANPENLFSLTGVASSPGVVGSSGSSDLRLILLLNRPMTDADSPALSGSGGITDRAGNPLVAASNFPITNTLDMTPPTVTGGTTLDATTIRLTLSEPVSGNGATPADFSVTGVASSPTVDSVTVAGSMADLNLTAAITDTDAPSVAYTRTSGSIDDNVGLALASFSGQIITNTIPPDTTAPTVTGGITANANTIRLTLSENVTNNGATPADFSVTGVASSPTVDSVTVSGDRVELGLSASMTVDDTPRVAYTVTTGSIGDNAGNLLADFSAFAVTNTLTDTTAPTVTLSTTPPSLPALTNLRAIPFTVRFSEVVRNFIRRDISVTGTANDNAPAASNFAGAGDAYTFDVERGASDGTVIVSIPAGVAMDFADNGNEASDTISLTVDRTPPRLIGDTTPDARTIELIFSEPVVLSGAFVATNFRISGVAAIGGTFIPPSIELRPEGDRVRLALPAPMTEADTPRISYNRRFEGDINDRAGNSLPNSSGRTITVALPPTVTGGTTLDATTIRLTLIEPVSDNSATPGDFAVAGVASNPTVSALTVAGSMIDLRLSAGITDADTPRVSYTMTSGSIDDNDVNPLANFSALTITNTLDTTAPTVTGGTTLNLSTIRLTLSEPVADNSATPTDFTVAGVASNPTVSALTVAGSMIDLRLSAGMIDADTPTLAYTITSGSIDDGAGNPLAGFPALTLTNTLDTTAPTVIAATTLDPTTIRLTLSEPVADNSATAGDFSVTGVASTSTVSTIAVTGTTVDLTLNAPMTDAETPRVAYTRTSGSIDDGAGLPLADFPALAVTNTLDTTLPTVIAATTLDATTIRLTLSEDVADNSATAGDFTITGVASSPTVTALAVAGSMIDLRLSAGTTDADTPTVFYTRNSGSIDDGAGNPLAGFLAFAVTNALDTTLPTVTGGTTLDLSTIRLTLSEDVADNSAPPTDFTVAGVASNPTVTALAVAGSMIDLRLSAGITDADTPTVAYTLSSGSIDDDAGLALAGFSAFAVTNTLDTTAPTVTAGTTLNATTIRLTLSESVTDNSATPTDFTVAGVTSNPTVSAIAVAGSMIDLALSAPMTGADTPRVAYTMTSGSIEDGAGLALAGFPALSLTNTLPPTVISGAILDLSTIRLTLSEPVSDNSATPTDFTVAGVASNPRVSALTVAGSMIDLALSAGMTGTDTPRVTYTLTSGSIDNGAGLSLAGFSDFSIINTLERIAPTVTGGTTLDLSTIRLTLSEPVADNSATPTDFSVTGVASGPTVTALAVGGSMVDLRLSAGITDADTPTLAYTISSGSIDDGAGNTLAGFAALTITNTLDTTAPVISLNGPSTVTLAQGTAYTDAGATCNDAIDGTPAVTTGGDTVDATTPPGIYTISYDCRDAAGNNAIQVTRTVTVTAEPAGVLDLNSDGEIEARDAQILYYFTLAPANLTLLLNRLRVALSLDQVRARALAWQGQDPPPDVNQDGNVDEEDAQILYYAERFGPLLRANPTLLRAVLGDLATNPAAALDNASRLRGVTTP